MHYRIYFYEFKSNIVLALCKEIETGIKARRYWYYAGIYFRKKQTMNITQAQQFSLYNQWMNNKLYDACERLSDQERKSDRKAFFGSIHGTLNHLLLGDKVWLSRFLNERFSVKGLDQILYDSFSELRQERHKTDDLIIDWASQLTEQELLSEFRYHSISNPGPKACVLWQAVTHLFNHQTHHRGQISTLLSQAGIDLGVTDLIAIPGIVYNLTETQDPLL
jgi:uncharacterized damage-inducible protein DinB